MNLVPSTTPAAVAAFATATIAATAPVATAASWPAAATAAAVPLRSGFLYCQRTPVHICAIQGLDGGRCLAVVAHLDEAEATRAAGVPIHHDFRSFHGAMCRKDLLQFRIGHVVGQIAYVQTLAHAGPPPKTTRGSVCLHGGATGRPNSRAYDSGTPDECQADGGLWIYRFALPGSKRARNDESDDPHYALPTPMVTITLPSRPGVAACRTAAWICSSGYVPPIVVVAIPS